MSSHLYFPPEVWGITLQEMREWKSQDELTYLWTTVRHVCRQFREEVEEIFRTEHLPKTWLRVDTRFDLPKRDSRSRKSGQPHFEFDSKLGFDCFKPKHPERAVFSFCQVPGKRTPPGRGTRVLGNLRDEAGLGVGGLASQTQSANRLRMIEHCTGLFVVQVRGGLNDCALTKLHIHMKNREVSFEWKDLFRQFFVEKRFTATVPEPLLRSNSTADEPCPGWIEKRAIPGGHEFMLAPHAHNMIKQLKPSLQALAESDRDRWCHNKREDNEFRRRLHCLRNPVQTWIEIAAGAPGEARLSHQSCRLRRKADHEIDIDEEGAINQARIGWEVEGKQVADAERSDEWNKSTMGCDSCREKNSTCGFNGQNPCNTCIYDSTECEWSLAVLNGHGSASDTSMWGGDTVRNNALADYHMQMMLLEQQNRKRLLASQPIPMMQAASQSSLQPTRLNDYQQQLMMLEQQNKQRLFLARQPTPMGFQPRPVGIPNSNN